MSSSNSLLDGESGYKVSLIRVAPGKEPTVEKQLRKFIVKDTGEQPLCLLKLFGRFDLCAVYKTKTYLDGPSRFGAIEGIRGGTKINAFHWLSNQEPQGLSVARGTGGVWAVSFFRFNESLVKLFGARIDQVVVEVSEGPYKNVVVDVLGTSGWAEMILLIRGHRFDDVTQTLSKISQQLVRYDIGTGHHQATLAAKTFSLIGLDFVLVRPGQKSRQKLLATLRERFSNKKAVYPSLSVTCPPSEMADIYKYGVREFGAGRETFGGSDLIFDPRPSSWGTFTAKVLDLRKHYRNRIYSTSVSTMTRDLTEFKTVRMKRPSKDKLEMPSPNSRLFRKWGKTLEHRLRDLYFSLSNFLQDPLTGDCFEDLRLMAETRLPLLLRDLSTEDQGQVDLLHEVVEVLAYGLEERAHGAFLSLEHLGSLSPTKGGIQRNLLAAEYIPRQVLSRLGKRWYGFVVAGYRNEFFSSHYEAINLPFEYLFTPHKWFGMFHEAGHVAFFDKSFYDMDGPELGDLLRRIVPGGPGDDPEYLKWKDLAWEIGADMFDLYFCYGPDLDFYFTNIWPLLHRRGKLITAEHFRRYFMVFAFWKHLLLPGKLQFPRRFDLNVELAAFRHYLRSLGLSTSAEPASDDEARLAFWGMARVTQVFFKRFREIASPRDLSTALSDPDMVKAIRSVRAGVPWLGVIREPDVFVLGLKKRRPLTFAGRLAALISLWNSAKRESSQ